MVEYGMDYDTIKQKAKNNKMFGDERDHFLVQIFHFLGKEDDPINTICEIAESGGVLKGHFSEFINSYDNIESLYNNHEDAIRQILADWMSLEDIIEIMIVDRETNKPSEVCTIIKLSLFYAIYYMCMIMHDMIVK